MQRAFIKSNRPDEYLETSASVLRAMSGTYMLYCAVRCPVLTCCIALRARYAMSGFDMLRITLPA
eukprot:1064907-Rhodomonas_salina.3